MHQLLLGKHLLLTSSSKHKEVHIIHSFFNFTGLRPTQGRRASSRCAKLLGWRWELQTFSSAFVVHFCWVFSNKNLDEASTSENKRWPRIINNHFQKDHWKGDDFDLFHLTVLGGLFRLDETEGPRMTPVTWFYHIWIYLASTPRANVWPPLTFYRIRISIYLWKLTRCQPSPFDQYCRRL